MGRDYGETAQKRTEQLIRAVDAVKNLSFKKKALPKKNYTLYAIIGQTTEMEEVNEFQLDKVSCKNHIPNEGFQMLGHLIEIHYMDGRVEKKKGWYSTKAISDLWEDDIEYVDILFSDI